jgi:phosphoribosylformylglycinamidine synthase subunit PurQ / glutaminase
VSARVAIVVFPGSNCEHDVAEALGTLGADPELVWHTSQSLSGFDAVVLPGGFAHGDYLRPGAIARFSPVMSAVAAFADDGGPVVGICNGFQILTEATLLPGAFRPNAHLRFICRPVVLQVVSTQSVLTGQAREGQLLEIPVNHYDGNYACSERALARLEERGQVVLRYTQNPNGSMRAIAGVCNPGGNVVGLMPHPERATDPLLGSTDGRVLLGSLIAATTEFAAAPLTVAMEKDTQVTVPSGTVTR